MSSISLPVDGTAPSTTICGIPFFSNRRECISHFENGSWMTRAVSFIKSCGTTIVAAWHKVSLVFRHVESKMAPFITADSRLLSKRRLIVCLHGLNSSPSQFKGVLDEVMKRDVSQTDIFIPRILKRGNAPLDELVRPILAEISKWAATQGDKELVLVGISNGGRISMAIEAQITKPENCGNITKLRVVSIVGACRGSTMASWAKRWHLGWFLSKSVYEEMPAGSERQSQLDRDWSASLKNPVPREYTFFASPHDWHVPSYDSTLPEVGNQKASYAIIQGYGHSSLPHGQTAKAIAEIIFSAERGGKPPGLAEAIGRVRLLRDSTTVVPHKTRDAAWAAIYRKTAPVFSLIDHLPTGEQEKIFGGYERSLDRMGNQTLLRQVLEAGNHLYAHGVEAFKTGLRGFLNIMLEGLLRSYWWGLLADGDPSFYSGPHGPYYIIIDDQRIDQDKEQPGIYPRLKAQVIDEKYHLAYLVPHEEHKQVLTTALRKAAELDFLTGAESDRLIGKVLTYQEFLALKPAVVAHTQAFKEMMARKGP